MQYFPYYTSLWCINWFIVRLYTCAHLWQCAASCKLLRVAGCLAQTVFSITKAKWLATIRHCAVLGVVSSKLCYLWSLVCFKEAFTCCSWGSPPPCETRWRLLEKPLAFAPRTATLQHAHAAEDGGKDAWPPWLVYVGSRIQLVVSFCQQHPTAIVITSLRVRRQNYVTLFVSTRIWKKWWHRLHNLLSTTMQTGCSLESSQIQDCSSGKLSIAFHTSTATVNAVCRGLCARKVKNECEQIGSGRSTVLFSSVCSRLTSWISPWCASLV